MQFLMAKTGYFVVVDHASRLHVRVHDGRPDESKPPLLQILAEQFRFLRHCRDLGHMLPPIDDRLVPDKLPNEGIEIPEFFLHFQEALGVANGRTNLELVADDRRILQQALILCFCELGDPVRLKIRSAINNAHRFLEVQQEFGSFDAYIWQFVGGKPILNKWETMQQIPAVTAESQVLSTDLKKRGFTFVGPTIMYAHMQAIGMVNDHVLSCFRYCEVQRLA